MLSLSDESPDDPLTSDVCRPVDHERDFLWVEQIAVG